jgi:hypothetical protein
VACAADGQNEGARAGGRSLLVCGNERLFGLGGEVAVEVD